MQLWSALAAWLASADAGLANIKANVNAQISATAFGMVTSLSQTNPRLSHLHLDKADRREVETVVRVFRREHGFHDAAGHHDLTGFQRLTP